MTPPTASVIRLQRRMEERLRVEEEEEERR